MSDDVKINEYEFEPGDVVYDRHGVKFIIKSYQMGLDNSVEAPTYLVMIDGKTFIRKSKLELYTLQQYRNLKLSKIL